MSMPYSLLDLSPVPEGFEARDAIRNTLDLAVKAEGWGYRRFWLAEHHNMPGIASAATAVLIGLVAQATSRIRVGAGEGRKGGAARGIRTPDPVITNDVLYQLSYCGKL